MSAHQVAWIIEDHPYPLIFATVTGSHVFGYASPLSDYDIHGAHLFPLQSVLGFDPPAETCERKEEREGVEVDIVTHDLKKFLLLLFKGNGNILESLYSPLVVSTSPLHQEITALGQKCITRQCAVYYQGMAANHYRRLKINDIKRLIHIYRCLLMSMHLMRSGQLEMNVPLLAQEYQQMQIMDLIEYKLSGMIGLDEHELAHHMSIVEELQARLTRETEESHLPERATPETRQELERILLHARMGSTSNAQAYSLSNDDQRQAAQADQEAYP